MSTDCCTEDRQKKNAEDTYANLQCHCNLWKFIVAKIHSVLDLTYLFADYINKMFYLVVGHSNQYMTPLTGGWYIPAQETPITSKR